MPGERAGDGWNAAKPFRDGGCLHRSRFATAKRGFPGSEKCRQIAFAHARRFSSHRESVVKV
jgi:hypothetical protein